MPIIIFGTKGKAVRDHEVAEFLGSCRNCGETVMFEPVRMKQYVSLFFIPIIPLGKGDPAIRCPNCDTKYKR